MVTLWPLFKLTVVCWFIFDGILNCCQWNPFTAQAANRWNDVDMPRCQRAKAWKHDSLWRPMMVEYWMRQLTTLLNLLPSHLRTITVVFHPRTPPAMARALRDGSERPPIVRWHCDKGQYSYQSRPCHKLHQWVPEWCFPKKMSGADKCSLRSQYTLLQNDLTRAPFLDAMMGSVCSKPCKSMDRKSAVLAAEYLEVLIHIL